jgi:hypothetical protein
VIIAAAATPHPPARLSIREPDQPCSDIPQADRDAITRLHPRPDFKRRILEAFTEGIRPKPETTFGNVKADVLEHFVPGFERGDFVRTILDSPWPE